MIQCYNHRHQLLLCLLCLLLLGFASTSVLHAQDEPLIGTPFRAHYWQTQGIRVLGMVQSPLIDHQDIRPNILRKAAWRIGGR